MLLSEYDNMSNTSDSSIANETGKTHTVCGIYSRSSIAVKAPHNMLNKPVFLNWGKLTDNMLNTTISLNCVQPQIYNMSNINNIPQLY